MSLMATQRTTSRLLTQSCGLQTQPTKISKKPDAGQDLATRLRTTSHLEHFCDSPSAPRCPHMDLALLVQPHAALWSGMRGVRRWHDAQSSPHPGRLPPLATICCLRLVQRAHQPNRTVLVGQMLPVCKDPHDDGPLLLVRGHVHMALSRSLPQHGRSGHRCQLARASWSSRAPLASPSPSKGTQIRLHRHLV
ncbi:unnamed protein product [Mortierella alpina]